MSFLIITWRTINQSLILLRVKTHFVEQCETVFLHKFFPFARTQNHSKYIYIRKSFKRINESCFRIQPGYRILETPTLKYWHFQYLTQFPKILFIDICGFNIYLIRHGFKYLYWGCFLTACSIRQWTGGGSLKVHWVNRSNLFSIIENVK